jgi:hypothetical protein
MPPPSLASPAAARPQTALHPPVKAFLEAQGFTVKGEIRGCNLVAIRPGAPDLSVIGAFKLGLSMDLLLQAADRLAIADEVWLAVPTPGRYHLTPSGAKAAAAWLAERPQPR